MSQCHATHPDHPGIRCQLTSGHRRQEHVADVDPWHWISWNDPVTAAV